MQPYFICSHTIFTFWQIYVISAWMHDTDVATIENRTVADIRDNGGQSIGPIYSVDFSVADFDSPNSPGT